MKNPSQLFSEFKPVSKADWLAKIEKDLKGKPLADLLQNIGGITLDPFHHSDEHGTLRPPISMKSSWEIGEDIEVGEDIKKANRQLLNALGNGVNAPRFILLKNISENKLAILLAGVNLEMISVHFYFKNKNASPQSLLPHLLKYVKTKGIKVTELNASFNWEHENAVDEMEMGRLLNGLTKCGRGLKALPVYCNNIFPENNTIDELAELIKKGEQYINRYMSEKYSPGFINSHLHFIVFINKNYFLQIAKMRALKLLWANILKAYKTEGKMPPIEAHISPVSQSENANTNMIAATTQAMSAIIGGADRLMVLPSDAYTGAATDFSKRIARNVQHILEMESYFDRVADPAAGSYFVEKLTVRLAEGAWGRFQKR